MDIEQNQISRILRAVDHTNLSVTATWEDIRETCEQALDYGCASACIPAYYVKTVHDVLPELRVCTVIGFPNGYSSTAAKCFEAEDAVKNGASEIDMVINNGLLASGLPEDVLDEINAVKDACGDAVLKVIIETCLLSRERKIEMCRVVSSSRADFIKTSTGFSKGGATVEDVALLRANTDARVGVKGDVVAARVAGEGAQRALAQLGSVAEKGFKTLHRRLRRVQQLRHARAAFRLGLQKTLAARIDGAQPVMQRLNERGAAAGVAQQIVLQVRVALYHPDVAQHFKEHLGRAPGDALAAQFLQQRPGRRTEQADDDFAIGKRGVVIGNFAQAFSHGGAKRKRWGKTARLAHQRRRGGRSERKKPVAQSCGPDLGKERTPQLFFLAALRIDGGFQGSAGRETGHTGSGDFDGRASLRVPASAGSTLGNIKGTEAGKGHFFVFHHAFGNDFEHGSQGTISLRARNFQTVGESLGEFTFVHISSSFGQWKKTALYRTRCKAGQILAPQAALRRTARQNPAFFFALLRAARAEDGKNQNRHKFA